MVKHILLVILLLTTNLIAKEIKQEKNTTLNYIEIPESGNGCLIGSIYEQKIDANLLLELPKSPKPSTEKYIPLSELYTVNEERPESFDDVELKRLKWNKLNTKTYTYIAITPTLNREPTLIFIKNNKIIQSLTLIKQKEKRKVIKPSDFNISKIDNFKTTKEKLTDSRSQYKNLPDLRFYLIDERFRTLLKENEGHYRSNYCYYDVIYDDKYSYVIEMINTYWPVKYKLNVNVRFYKYKGSPLKYFASKSLLMLPLNINYSKEVTQKILLKYQKTYTCINKQDTNKTKCVYDNLIWEEQ